MLFKKYTVYENKLSEKLSDDNPLKQKLIDMETPTDKHTLYLVLVYSLFIYCCLFLITMCYFKSYAYKECILVMFFSTFCLYITNKKNILELSKNTHILILGGAVLISILLEIQDSTNTSFNSLWKTFLFFIEINQKSYISFTIIAFFMVGISLSYTTSIYKAYESFYKFQKQNNNQFTTENIINANYNFAFILCIIFPYVIYLSLDDAQDVFRLNIKLLSLAIFFELPPYIFRCFCAKKYLKLFNKAHKFDVNLMREAK